jgi:hypothetical protein
MVFSKSGVQPAGALGSNHSFDLVWLDLLFRLAPAAQFRGGVQILNPTTPAKTMV